MWPYALYLYVCPVYLSVCCLFVLCTTRQHNILLTLQLQEAANLHELTKAEGTRYDKAMESRHWIHPSKHIAIVEGQEKTTHSLQVYTDGCKDEAGGQLKGGRCTKS
jgi:hypothetical protein